jgi:hypothetical protein
MLRSTRWVMLTNGEVWQWLDAQRPFGERFAGLRLEPALGDERVWEALWLMGRPVTAGTTGAAPVLERLIALSVSLELVATRAIRDGVFTARECLARQLQTSDEESLTLIFRWLFLLFAEARGLAPVHNPIYRQAYALSTLARYARTGQPPFGLWESLMAAGRLAHTGSEHPALTMTALNGSLFDPASTPQAARRRLPDAVAASLLRSLTTVERQRQEQTVAFGDLDVEHLGTIYEDVLASPVAVLDRKRTGTFYTPRDLADYLVARTLTPLTAGRPVEEILALRIVDPAMGSGAILASAARHLMAAVDAAWMREGRTGPLDVSPDERSDTARRIVEQCLYGVDRNPRAVQIARLSLWLTSMARERPLTFLDNHLRCGNSLIGATPGDVVSRLPGRAVRRAPGGDTQPALFDLAEWDREAGRLSLALTRLAALPSGTAADVRAKARHLRSLQAGALLARWRRRADLWCGAWMAPTPPAPGLWRAIDASAQDGRRPHHRTVTDRADEFATLARDADCFHWPLEFADVFHGQGPSGFDAVVANPPWEMLRADLGSHDARRDARTRLRCEWRFLAGSGQYGGQASGHANLYRLFVERMLALCAPGARLGVITPWGMASDHTAGRARERLFRLAAVDEVTAVENARRIFPIHRSVRFAVLTATTGRPTRGFVLRTGLRSADELYGRGSPPGLWVDMAVAAQAGGADLPVPCLRTAADLRVLERLVASGPRLETAPWSVGFSRELNASDNRDVMCPHQGRADDLPVLAGRHLAPWRATVPPEGPWVSRAHAERTLKAQGWTRWRLGYRDVSSAGNRLSLIAALVPPGVVTTHTVFVLRRPLGLRTQLYLLAVFNSLVANWFVRLYMGSHVTSALVGRLPVPQPEAHPALARRLIRLAARLRRLPAGSAAAEAAEVDLQAGVARLYGIPAPDMTALVSTFPLLPASLREGICAACEKA